MKETEGYGHGRSVLRNDLHTATCALRETLLLDSEHSDLFPTQHRQHVLSVRCTLDRRARFSSSSSRSLSCRTSSCNGSWQTVKDSLKRRGVEQLESVSLSSEAMETIRSRSSFFDSSCCSWLTQDKGGSPPREVHFIYTISYCIIYAASRTSLLLNSSHLHLFTGSSQNHNFTTARETKNSRHHKNEQQNLLFKQFTAKSFSSCLETLFHFNMLAIILIMTITLNC